MATSAVIASFKHTTLFIFISFSVNIVQTIPHRKLPTAELTEIDSFCQNEQLLSSMRVNITTALQSIAQDFFDNLPQCGHGPWKRIANINMSDISHQCPSNWSDYPSPGNIRSCGRPLAERSRESCVSTYFSSSNYEYNRVCGRATGYQVLSTDAFGPSQGRQSFDHTINDAYVDGLSLTYGRERTHIWTFAAGHSEANDINFACYCGDNTTYGSQPPAYVGRNFFCESAINTNVPAEYDTFYVEDPLWDGQDCPYTNCCTFNSPPWFSIQLPTSTVDDIEARICLDESSANEDLTVSLLEIYVQ